MCVNILLLDFDIGRGTGSIDEEGRTFSVSTVDITVWHVKEYSYKVLPVEDFGHFHSGEGKLLSSSSLYSFIIVIIMYSLKHEQ